MRARLERVPLLAAAMASLLFGLAVGLVRLGWPIPLAESHAEHLEIHGPLMVCGFLGTVISLERAVALDRVWAFSAPLLAALGLVALLVAPGSAASGLLMIGAGLALAAIYAAALTRLASLFTATMGVGAVFWLAGNVLWHRGWPLRHVVILWAGFVVLTIAGERLELTRFLRPTRLGRATFLVVLGLLVASAGAAIATPEVARRLAGLGLLCLAAWLGRYDVARRTVRQAGLTRFMATCLLSGYFWLAVAGALALCVPGDPSGPLYDAAVHALFVGFAFAMIFGHAPVIFPAVVGGSMAFHRRFYAHLALLHASLAIRVAGDLDIAWLDGGWGGGRRWGGLLGAAAILLFLANTVSSLRRSNPDGGGPLEPAAAGRRRADPRRKDPL